MACFGQIMVNTVHEGENKDDDNDDDDDDDDDKQKQPCWATHT
jgi:hypothetical protein